MDKTNMEHILKIIQELKSTNSRIEKEEILNQYKDNELFKKCIKYAYHPQLKFNVKSIDYIEVTPELKKRYGNVDNIFRMLDYLSNKRGCTEQERRTLATIASACGREAVEVVNLILKKNFDCGCSIKTFRKYFPDIIPTFELMKPISEIRAFMNVVKDPKYVVWSVKLDGVRDYCIIDLNNRTVEHWSTRGKQLNNFHHFDTELLRLGEEIRKIINLNVIPIDGEVTYHSDTSSAIEDFQKGLTQITRKGEIDINKLRYQIFGIPLDGFNFIKQYELLKQIDFSKFDKLVLVRHCVYDGEWSEDGLKKHAQNFIDQGREGVVYKDMRYVFERKRSNRWLRIKRKNTVDIPVIGFEYGTGKYKNVVGALICMFNGREVKVGSGLTDEDRIEFLQELPKIIEVEYDSITKDGSLRNPIFKRVRDDKA